MTMRNVICGLLLGLLLVTGAQAQPPASASSSGPPATTFVVKIKVKEGKNAEFEKVFADMAASVRAKEPGNIYYELYHLPKDSQTYVILEHYKDAAAVAAHGKGDYGQKFFAALKDLQDGPADAQFLVFVGSK
jgi:quinol monooxygenase YgiN